MGSSTPVDKIYSLWGFKNIFVILYGYFCNLFEDFQRIQLIFYYYGGSLPMEPQYCIRADETFFLTLFFKFSNFLKIKIFRTHVFCMCANTIPLERKDRSAWDSDFHWSFILSEFSEFSIWLYYFKYQCFKNVMHFYWQLRN